MRQYNWTWPSISDPGRVLARRLGFGYQPAFMLVDAQGRLVAAHQGPGSPAIWDRLAAQLKR